MSLIEKAMISVGVKDCWNSAECQTTERETFPSLVVHDSNSQLSQIVNEHVSDQPKI
ncbi:hypothetical protein HETIRDRAFT_142009 [Heterobasidion irregulare TC 32-1]|uniref:Uncharacterized protein n=1 Tax=Heterobasidion irregulare (strain TC 32-1) TaxID=747525 RepID=W4KEP8_HETIT|nr:uncharacterized protein HETIRDRAFT_142009 [Heterobasidion irregulare TC 32-1]ETW83551.1 hypothetical protein HETIRDRAFT_142009 [Heterobasidion irregulare TC 32-1]